MARSNTAETAREARALVIKRLQELGAKQVREEKIGNVTFLHVATPGGSVVCRVKSRRSGDWQISLDVIDPDSTLPSPNMWIFMDLPKPGYPARYYVVPDNWLKNDIQKDYREYLDRNGGQRAVTQDSDHHAITTDRLEKWRGRWDQLGF